MALEALFIFKKNKVKSKNIDITNAVIICKNAFNATITSLIYSVMVLINFEVFRFK